MKISVITATFNSASTLESTLESFRSQEYKNKELIIIDGGSTDGSKEIIRNAGDVVQKWVSEPDQGIYDALNKGIRMSEGDVIGFLHSGDLYADSNVLQKIIIPFQESQVDIIYGDLRYVNKDKRKRVVRYWKSGEFHPGLIQKGWMPPHPTFYMRREIYASLGLFDLSFKIAADYDLMLRVLKNPGLKIAYIPEVLVEMETGGLSNGRLVNVIRKSIEDYRAMRKNGIMNPWWVLGRKNLGKLNQFFDI
jgi:glycosyltransferase involved in cell wall biosynthesis